MDIKQSMIDNITNAAVNVIQPNKDICIRCRGTIGENENAYELANMFPRGIVFCKSCIDDCHDKDNKHDEDFLKLKNSIQEALTNLIVEATKKAVTTMIAKKIKTKAAASTTPAPTTTAAPSAATSEPTPTPAPTSAKVPKKSVNKRLQNMKEQYEKAKEDFVSGNNSEIYNLMENIAKKKYYKDEECAAYQEEFYQDFMQNAINWNTSMHNSKLHDKLVNSRAKTA
jgi:hypothetical protein